MSDIFKKMKSLFVEEIAETPDSAIEKKDALPSRRPSTNPKTTSSDVPKTVQQPSIRQNVAGEVDEKFTTILLKAMEANNLDGLDYLEFKQSLQALSKMPMDEETRFKSAFAMAASMGATPELLVRTAGHYLDVLATEDKKFTEAMQQQISGKIGQQQQEVASMEKSIQEKSEQIKQLTNQIGQIQKKVQSTKLEMQEASEKINTTKGNFIASYNLLRGQIENDIASMKKYLGGDASK